MRTPSVRHLITVLGVTLLVAGCGGDGPTGVNEGDELTQLESEEIFAEIFEELGELFAFAGGGGASSVDEGPISFYTALVKVQITETIQESGSCEGGGSVSVSGSLSGDLDEEAGTGKVSLDVTETISNCVVSVAGGTTFTVNTNPSIRMTGDFDFGETSLSAHFSINGGFSFNGDDGRSGSCAIRVSVDLDVTETSVVESVSGSVCGRNVSDI